MERKIEDYLHLYLGCKVEWGFENRKKIGTLIGKTIPFGWQIFDSINPIVPYHNVKPELIKLILRPLSHMTEEEEIEVSNITNLHMVTYLKQAWVNKTPFKIDLHEMPSLFVYLCRQGFDLFGLIESGLAINKTTYGE